MEPIGEMVGRDACRIVGRDATWMVGGCKYGDVEDGLVHPQDGGGAKHV